MANLARPRLSSLPAPAAPHSAIRTAPHQVLPTNQHGAILSGNQRPLSTPLIPIFQPALLEYR